MYITINNIDYTQQIDPVDGGSDNGAQGIQFSASLSDPNSTCDFMVDDPTQSIQLMCGMPVIVWDETLPAYFENIATDPYHTFAPTIASTPAVNWVVNDFLGSLGGWTASGSLGSMIQPIGGHAGATITFSNTAVGTGLLTQQTIKGYVQPGQSYIWSIWSIAPVATTNVLGTLQIIFEDGSGNQVGFHSTTWAPTTTQQRVSFEATAPANAVYATFAFGFETTNATNSGQLIWQFPQFEPMWFGWAGVQYPTDDCNFAHINSVIMPDGTCSRMARIFAGYIEDLVVTYVGKQRYYAVSCAASPKYLENFGLVTSSFTSQYDTQILTTVLGVGVPSNQYYGVFSTGQQNAFSPATTTLVQGVLVDSITFTNNTLREVLNNLSNLSGYQFYVDPYFYVWYVPPSFVSQTLALSDEPDDIMMFAYHDFQVEYDFTQPASRVLVMGAKQNAAAITDTFSGNASTTVFSLSEPPYNIQTVTVGGSSIRTGVSGKDTLGSTFKALVNKQAQTITFQTAPASGTNNVVVTYTYEDPVVAQVLSADAIAQQGRPYDLLVNDSNLTSTTAAKNRGLAELTKSAFAKTILTFSTRNIYAPVGSLVLFTCAGEQMAAAPFTIQTVQSAPQGGGIYEWQYTAGAYNPTLIDHLRNTSKAVTRSTTTANVPTVVSIDVAIFDSLHLADSVVVNANGVPPAGPYLYGSAQYGFASYS